MWTRPEITMLKNSSRLLTLGLGLLLSLSGLVSNSACENQSCCVEDAECADGLRCIAGSCTPRCASDQQCLYGQICDTKLLACVGGAYRNNCSWHFADADAGAEDAATDAATAADSAVMDRQNSDHETIDAGPIDALALDAEPGPDADFPDSPFPFPDGSYPWDATWPGDASWPDVPFPFLDAGNTDAILPACVDDNYEQNDELGSASSIQAGQLDALMCQADDDFYAFDVEQDQHLRLNLRFSASVGDLDMALFNGSGNQVALSQGVDPFEEIELQAPRSERYTTRIYGYNQAEGPYRLDLCLDDEFEENDRMGRAPQIASGVYDLTLCSGDSDYFRLEVSAGANIVIQLNAASSDINYEQLKLYGRGQSLLATAISASSDPNMLLLSYQVQDEQVVFLAIEDAGQPSTNYQLNIDLGD